LSSRSSHSDSTAAARREGEAPAGPRALPVIGRTAIALATLLFLTSPIVAQTATPAAPTPLTGGRSLTFEYIIVVVMIGLALFAVCRGSRRN